MKPAASSARLRELVSLAVFVIVFAPIWVFVRMLSEFLDIIGWHHWLPRVQSILRIRRRVLFLEVFYPASSGYTYRVGVWLPVLREAGFTTTVRYPLNGPTFHRLLDGGWTGLFLAAFLVRRSVQCLTAPFYNCVIVRRELLLYNDYGNLFLERLILALNPRVLLDFDDDIAAAKSEPRQATWVGRRLGERTSKFTDSLNLYPRFIAGSSYLADLVRHRRCTDIPTDIEVIPTCVDFLPEWSKHYDQISPVVSLGWIGTNGNLPELEAIVPSLNAICRDVPIRLVVIGGRDLGVATEFPVDNRRWSLETQIEDLLELDIGLMPLHDTIETRGKCGLKLIQYMGLGIVGVASAVTSNREIVSEDGANGFLVEPDADWEDALRRVLSHRAQFATIGASGRERVRSRYSVAANADRYVNCVRRACFDEERRLETR